MDRMETDDSAVTGGDGLPVDAELMAYFEKIRKTYHDDPASGLAGGINFAAATSAHSLALNSRVLFQYLEAGAVPPQYAQWSDYNQQLYQELQDRHREWMVRDRISDDRDVLLEPGDIVDAAPDAARADEELRAGQTRRATRGETSAADARRRFNNAQNIETQQISRRARSRAGAADADPLGDAPVVADVDGPSDLAGYLMHHNARNIRELLEAPGWTHPERDEGDVRKLSDRLYNLSERVYSAGDAPATGLRTAQLLSEGAIETLYTSDDAVSAWTDAVAGVHDEYLRRAAAGEEEIANDLSTAARFLSTPMGRRWTDITPEERRQFDNKFISAIVNTPCSEWVRSLDDILVLGLFLVPTESSTSLAHKFMSAVVARLMMAFDHLAAAWARSDELPTNARAEFAVGAFPGQCETSAPFLRGGGGGAPLPPPGNLGGGGSASHCDQLYEFMVGKYPGEDDGGGEGGGAPPTDAGRMRRLFHRYLESSRYSDPRAVFLYWVRPYSLPPQPDAERFPETEQFAVPVRNRYDMEYAADGRTVVETEGEGLDALFTFLRTQQLVSKTGVTFMRNGAREFAARGQAGLGAGKTAHLSFFLGETVSEYDADKRAERPTVRETAALSGANARELISMYQHLAYTHFINAVVFMYLTSGALVNLNGRGVVADPTGGRYVPGVVFPAFVQRTLDRVRDPAREADPVRRASPAIKTAAEVDAAFDFLFTRQHIRIEPDEVHGPPRYTVIVPRLIEMYRSGADGAPGSAALAQALARLDSVFMAYTTEYAPGTYIDKSARDPFVRGTDHEYGTYIRRSVSRARYYDFRDESAAAFGSAGAAQELLKLWTAALNAAPRDPGTPAWRAEPGAPRDPPGAVPAAAVDVPLWAAPTDVAGPAARAWYTVAELERVVANLAAGILPHMSFVLSPGFVDFITPYMGLVRHVDAASGGVHFAANVGAHTDAESRVNVILRELREEGLLPHVRTPVALLRRAADAIGYAPQAADTAPTGRFVPPPAIRRHAALRDLPNDDDEDATMRDMHVVAAVRSPPVLVGGGADFIVGARQAFDRAPTAAAYTSYLRMVAATLAAGGELDPSFFAAHRDAEELHRSLAAATLAPEGLSPRLLRVARKAPVLLLHAAPTAAAPGRNLLQDVGVGLAPHTGVEAGGRAAALQAFADAAHAFFVMNEVWLNAPTPENAKLRATLPGPASAQTPGRGASPATAEYKRLAAALRTAGGAALRDVQAATERLLAQAAQAVTDGSAEARAARRALLLDVLVRDSVGQQPGPAYVALRNLEIAFEHPVAAGAPLDGVFVAPVYSHAARHMMAYDARQLPGPDEGQPLRAGLEAVEREGAVAATRLEDAPHTLFVSAHDAGTETDTLVNALLTRDTADRALRKTTAAAVAMGIGQGGGTWIRPAAGGNKEAVYRLVRAMQHCRLLGQCQHFAPAQLEVLLRVLYPDLANIANGFGATADGYAAVRGLLARGFADAATWDAALAVLGTRYAAHLERSDDHVRLVQDLQEMHLAAGVASAVVEDDLDEVRSALREIRYDLDDYVPTSFLLRELLDADGTLYPEDSEPTLETLLLWCCMRVCAIRGAGKEAWTKAEAARVLRDAAALEGDPVGAAAGHLVEHVTLAMLALLPGGDDAPVDYTFFEDVLVPHLRRKWAALELEYGAESECELALLVELRVLPSAEVVADSAAHAAWLRSTHLGMALGSGRPTALDTMAGRQALYVAARRAATILSVHPQTGAGGGQAFGWDGQLARLSLADVFQFGKTAHYQYSPEHMADVVDTHAAKLLALEANRAAFQPPMLAVSRDAYAKLFPGALDFPYPRMTFVGMMRRLLGGEGDRGAGTIETLHAVGRAEDAMAEGEGEELALATWRAKTNKAIAAALADAAGLSAEAAAAVFPAGVDLLDSTYKAFEPEVRAFLKLGAAAYVQGAEGQQREFNGLRPFLSLDFGDHGEFTARTAEYLDYLRETAEASSKEARAEIAAQIVARCHGLAPASATIPPSILASGASLETLRQNIGFRADRRADGVAFRMYLLCRAMRLRCYFEQLEGPDEAHSVLPPLIDHLDKVRLPAADVALQWKDVFARKDALHVNYFKKTLAYILAALAGPDALPAGNDLGEALLAMFIYSDAFVQDAGGGGSAPLQPPGDGAPRDGAPREDAREEEDGGGDGDGGLFAPGTELPDHPSKPGFATFFERMHVSARAYAKWVKGGGRGASPPPLESDNYYGIVRENVPLFLSFTTRGGAVPPYESARNPYRRPFVADRVCLGFDRVLVAEKTLVVHALVKRLLAECRWDAAPVPYAGRSRRMLADNPYYLRLARSVVRAWKPRHEHGDAGTRSVWLKDVRWPDARLGKDALEARDAMINVLYAAQEAFNANPALDSVLVLRNRGGEMGDKDLVRIRFDALLAAATATPADARTYTEPAQGQARARLRLVSATSFAFVVDVDLEKAKLTSEEHKVRIPDDTDAVLDAVFAARGAFVADGERWLVAGEAAGGARYAEYSVPQAVEGPATYGVGLEEMYGTYAQFAGELDGWRQFAQVAELAALLVPTSVTPKGMPDLPMGGPIGPEGATATRSEAVVEALARIEPLFIFGHHGGRATYGAVRSAAGASEFRGAVRTALRAWFAAYVAHVRELGADAKRLFTDAARPATLAPFHRQRGHLTLFHFPSQMRPVTDVSRVGADAVPGNSPARVISTLVAAVRHTYVFLLFLDRRLHEVMRRGDSDPKARALAPPRLDDYAFQLVDHLKRLPFLQRRMLPAAAGSGDALVGVYTPPTVAGFELLSGADVQQRRFLHTLHNERRAGVGALADLTLYGATVLHTMLYDAWRATNTKNFDPRRQNDAFMSDRGSETAQPTERVFAVVTHKLTDALGKKWEVQTPHLATVVPKDTASASVRAALRYEAGRNPYRNQRAVAVARGTGLYTGAAYNREVWANFWRMGNTPLAFFIESKAFKDERVKAADGYDIDPPDADVFGLTDFGLWFVYYDRSFLKNWRSPFADSDLGFKELNTLGELDFRARAIASAAGAGGAAPTWPKGELYVPGNYYIYAPLVPWFGKAAARDYASELTRNVAATRGVSVFLANDYRSAYDKTPALLEAKASVGGTVHAFNYQHVPALDADAFAALFHTPAEDDSEFFFRAGQDGGGSVPPHNGLVQMMAFVVGIARQQGYALMHLGHTTPAGDALFTNKPFRRADAKLTGVYESFREEINLAQLWIATDHRNRHEFANHVVSGHRALLLAMAGAATPWDLFTLMRDPLIALPLKARELFKRDLAALFGLAHINYDRIRKEDFAPLSIGTDTSQFSLDALMRLCFFAGQSRAAADGSPRHMDAGTFIVVNVARVGRPKRTMLTTRVFERAATSALMVGMPKDKPAHTYMLVHHRRRWFVLRHDKIPFSTL